METERRWREGEDGRMELLNELALVPTATVWARYDDLVIDGRSLATYL